MQEQYKTPITGRRLFMDDDEFLSNGDLNINLNNTVIENNQVRTFIYFFLLLLRRMYLLTSCTYVHTHVQLK